MKAILITITLLIGLSTQAQDQSFYVNQDESIEQYQQLQKHYQHKAKRGRIWAISGAAVFVPGYIIMLVGVETEDPFPATAGLAMVGYSFFAFNIGMPSWMFNAAKAKANGDKVKQMKQQNRYMPKDLSFGATSNGVGLILGL